MQFTHTHTHTVVLTSFKLSMVFSMLERLGGCSAAASILLGSPMSRSLALKTVDSRGQRWGGVG